MIVLAVVIFVTLLGVAIRRTRKRQAQQNNGAGAPGRAPPARFPVPVPAPVPAPMGTSSRLPPPYPGGSYLGTTQPAYGGPSYPGIPASAYYGNYAAAAPVAVTAVVIGRPVTPGFEPRHRPMAVPSGSQWLLSQRPRRCPRATQAPAQLPPPPLMPRHARCTARRS
ncbi:hypothetical protein T492DRAFT_385479 [Pavlovales sp. CCMP2436]|nr:hypothetical protein T492DRAFT_385479 [Pavlovales sp. CCMP2436]